MSEFPRQDLANFYQLVVKNVARQLGVKNPEWRPVDELYTEISNFSVKVHDLLLDFFDAYQDWYECLFDEHGIEKPVDSTPDASARYRELFNVRNQIRNELLQEIEEIIGQVEPNKNNS